jgi:acetyl/propionyl-CoA carboxylase alpha subunit
MYQLPVGDGIRVDNGFEQGMDILIHYDPSPADANETRRGPDYA